jgi:hypothetical protein
MAKKPRGKPGNSDGGNHAERELHQFVMWRKRSFGTQSDRGNLFAERVMTVSHTARKSAVAGWDSHTSNACDLYVGSSVVLHVVFTPQ